MYVSALYRANRKVVVLSLPETFDREGLVPISDGSECAMKASGEQATDKEVMKMADKQAMKTSPEEAVKPPSECCLSLLGFLPQDCVHQHQIVGNSTKVVMPYPEDQVRSSVKVSVCNIHIIILSCLCKRCVHVCVWGGICTCTKYMLQDIFQPTRIY